MANTTVINSIWQVETANGTFDIEIAGLTEKKARSEFSKKYKDAGNIINIRMLSKAEKTQENTTNGNGKIQAVATPIDPENITFERNLEPDFIDYLPSKVIHNTMLVIEGDRIKSPEDITACAVGNVHLQIGSKKFNFGVLKPDSITLDQSVFALPEKTNDAISYEDVIALKAEVEKMWCLGVKVQIAKAKEASKKAKNQSRKDKMKAITAIL